MHSRGVLRRLGLRPLHTGRTIVARSIYTLLLLLLLLRLLHGPHRYKVPGGLTCRLNSRRIVHRSMRNRPVSGLPLWLSGWLIIHRLRSRLIIHGLNSRLIVHRPLHFRPGAIGPSLRLSIRLPLRLTLRLSIGLSLRLSTGVPRPSPARRTALGLRSRLIIHRLLWLSGWLTIHRIVLPVGKSRADRPAAAIDRRILRPRIIQIAHPGRSHTGRYTHIAVIVPGRIVYPGTVNVQTAVVYLSAGHRPVGSPYRHGP